jgi:beta-lactam-binding protein with PASTA domain
VATFANGTTVTLTVKRTGRNRFAGWSGDCSGTGTCVLSMTVDHAVTATFTRPLAPVSCTVPKLLGLSLSKARAKIRRAHCSVGVISRKSSTGAKSGKVLTQAPKAGKKLRNGAKVGLTVGKGSTRR